MNRPNFEWVNGASLVMNIKLKADNYHKKQYKKLLCSEWRHDTVFSLTDNFLNSGGLPVSYSKRTDAAEWDYIKKLSKR